MKNLLNNLIEVIGISDILPENLKYFKQFQVQEYFDIPSQKPDMEQILRITITPEIIETKVIITPEAESHEGQKLKGTKLLISGKLVQKIEYIADDPLQSIHAAESEMLFANYIVLDNEVDCSTFITVIPYIEDIYIKQINERQVFKNIMLLINAVSPLSNAPRINMEWDKEDKLVDRHKKFRHCCCEYAEKKYFSQFSAVENIVMPCSKPDIEQIVSAIAEPEVISMKTIKTARGLSCEGQYLSGKKIVVELKIRQKILYASDTKVQSIHGVESEFYHSIYVIVPEYIEGTSTDTLLKNKMLLPKLKVEDIYVKPLDKRSIFKNITLLLEFFYVPTYEICYSGYHNCTSSNLFIMYEDGLHNISITNDEDKKNIKPNWAPDGQHVAYLVENKEKYSLENINIKDFTKNQLISPGEFDSIGSFCWSADGRKIIFSAIKDNSKEIFSLDVKNLDWQQLTNGNSLVKSYKPKCSPDGGKIAYLRASSNIPDLWFSDINGFNSLQATHCDYVKDFDWLKDGKTVIGISDKGNSCDELFSIDINCMEKKILPDCKNIHEKKLIRVSPDNRYAAFIGSIYSKGCLGGIYNIYVYELYSNSVVNITNYLNEIKISDLVWKIDSSKIYYASNELGYFNIYSISLDTLCKRQLTNSTASNMQLSYRPRVK